MSIFVQFLDQSDPGPSGPITAWAWNFGDGGTSTSENPSHTYSTGGTYTVTLTVTGSGTDGTATVTHPTIVTAPSSLAANFSFTESGLSVSFLDTSIPGPSGPITGWAWTFGDGGTSTSQNPSHTYSTGGTYTTALTVTGTSPDGTANVSHSVTVSAVVVSPSYRPYIDASAINQKIPSQPPIHPDTSLMISVANHWLLGGTAYDQYKEWMGASSSGSSRSSYYRGDTSLLPTIQMYSNQNGWVGAGPYTMPMPTWMAAVHGPFCQAGDGNIVIVDSITGDVTECWHATPPGYTPRNSGFPSTRWNCSAYRHWANGATAHLGYNLSTFTGADPPGTSGSNIQLAAGQLVPEDFADCFSGSDPGTVIPHVLRMNTFCGSAGTTYPRSVAPGRAGDGTQSHGIPAGGRAQLDPSIDVSTWPSVLAKPEPWRSALKKMLRTLQIYGIIQVDSYAGPGNGSIDCASGPSIANGGTTYAAGYKWPWDVAGVGGGYKHSVPYDLMSHFRVIDWTKWTGT